MQFFGRNSELEHLESEFSKDNSTFVAIYGRRRVGKTRLIKEFINEKNALYFLASKESEVLNLQDFSRAVDEFTGTSHTTKSRYDNWRDPFIDIVNFKSNEKKVIVIDEFPYLIKENSAIPSIFQWIWDEKLRDANIMLILCGSHMSMMIEHIFNYSSPLYGRRTSQIKLKPISFSEFNANSTGSFENKIERYAITGGVPRYLEFFYDASSIQKQLESSVFSTNSFLYEEPMFLLKDEVETPVTYLSILKTISMGRHKPSEIATVLEKKSNDLSPYLNTLIDLGFIEKQVPITENNPEKSRKGLYFISDNFMRFWFKYVAPNKSQLEIDNKQTVWEAMDKDFISSFVARSYEDICKDIFLNLWKTGSIDYSPTKIGSFWQGDMQIDVVCPDNSHKKVFFGECKYHEKPIDADVYFDLKKKVTENKELTQNFAGYEFIYGIFSKSGFTQRLLDVAKDNEDLLLINEDKIIV
ncbi:MAG: ATP-binding protein [Clostridiales bacterium]|jgi:AAA+ ATPase superfamily predicted ATPase|nr:ATP-binding protein [Clostridiales bacterium]